MLRHESSTCIASTPKTACQILPNSPSGAADVEAGVSSSPPTDGPRRAVRHWSIPGNRQHQASNQQIRRVGGFEVERAGFDNGEWLCDALVLWGGLSC